MTQSEALARAQQLRLSLLDHGVRAVTIELVEGRGSAGWSDDRFVGTMGHHIVSHRGQGLTPGLRLVKVGRTDLPGPLCNGYGGFDEVARIICMGWANHPGAGGPYTLPSGTVPANNGRPYLFGWEHEGGMFEADWPPSFRSFMGACHAGTLAWLGLDEESHIEHKTWAPGRKTDRLGYTLAEAHAEIMPHLVEDEGNIMWSKDLNEAGWRALARAGIAAGNEEDVVQYWVRDGAQRTDAEHKAASANMLPLMLANLARFTDNPDSTSTGGLTETRARELFSEAGHRHDEGVTGPSSS